MSKYQFDGSNYENWKPEEFPTGLCMPRRWYVNQLLHRRLALQSSYLGFREMLQLHAVLGLLPRFLY